MDRPIPTGRLGRLTRLAAAGLRGRHGTGEAGARDVADTLGTLRGLPAKLGQLYAYVDGLAPVEPDEAAAMGSLLASTPPSSPARIRETVERELGAPLDRLFAEWEDAPMASASIGQVHRARLPDGTRVAVKVQHPGVVEAVEHDLANAALLERAASLLVGRGGETRQLLEDLAERFREELDYTREAAWQERFRALHAGDPTIRIPAVFRSHAARRVLTTELAEGLPFDAACAAPERARAEWCRTLWRFVFKGTVTAGLFNADPHPGNYLFQPDGNVVFLDFGCVQTRDEASRASDESLHRAALARDEVAFAVAVRRLLGLRAGAQEERITRQVRRMYEPLFSSPARVDRAFVAGMLRSLRESRRARADEPRVPLPRGTIFMERLRFGFYSVLARLDAEVDYAAVERAFLPGA